MAVAFDAGNSTVNGSAATTTPITITVGAGSDRALMILVGGVATADTPSSVVSNVDGALTLAGSVTSVNPRVFAWIIANPTSGAHTVTVTHASSRPAVFAAAFTGVDQSTPIGTPAGSVSANGTSPVSTSVTVISGGMAVDIIAHDSSLNAFTATAGQSAVAAQVASNGSTYQIAAGYLLNATAMSWSWTLTGGSDAMSHAVFPLRPASAPAGSNFVARESGIRGLNRGLFGG